MAAGVRPAVEPEGLSAPAPAADGQPNQRGKRNCPNRPSRRGRLLGAPLGARSTHVVQLGTVGIEQRFGEAAEQVAELCRQARGIAEGAHANRGPGHQHGDAIRLASAPVDLLPRLLVTARGMRFARVALNLRKLSTAALHRRSLACCPRYVEAGRREAAEPGTRGSAPWSSRCGDLALRRASRYISASSPTYRRRWVPDRARRAPMARQFIYHMQGLSKIYPGNRKILENVNLSFYPDAKIGVLGVNGSGKSTLLRIMAGIDKEFAGEAWAAEGARVGYLEQEPQLDAAKSVRENVMEGVAPQKAILDRYNELAVNYSDDTADEMTRLQDEIEAKGLWDLDSKVDQAMDALRCPPDDADVAKLSGGERRRVALCRLLLEQPDLLLLDEPTNHLDAESVSWLEGHLRD